MEQAYRKMLRGKIHRATVTDANLDYEGSITIPQSLLTAAGFLEHEAVQIWNVTNGNRFETYTLLAPEGEQGAAAGDDELMNVICVNGAAAHLAKRGDKIIIAAFGWFPEAQLHNYEPQVVFVDERNRPVTLRKEVATVKSELLRVGSVAASNEQGVLEDHDLRLLPV